MHRGDVAMVETGAPLKRKAKGLLARLFLAVGPAASLGARLRAFRPDILLEDGQELNEFGLAARVLHTPGHTPGSITVLTEDGRLFVGDTVMNRKRVASAQFIEDEQELRTSIALLQGVNAQVVYPGHGQPFPFAALSSIAG